MEKLLGTKLADRYLIEDIVGVGGMCNVYRAFDTETSRTVAVKLLRDEYASDGEYLRRFRHESKAIRAVAHPSIVKIYDVVLDAPNPFLVMEFVDGVTLKEHIERKKTLEPAEAANIAGLILTTLRAAHENGVVHRDVKPQNIMLTRDGRIKVMDFGIARFAMNQSRTVDGNAIGTVHYISPEQARGENVDERTDIYSVGVILFEMLTGELPFDAESPISVALQQIEKEPRTPRSINPALPPGLEQITMRAMAKNPEDRYPTCDAMIRDLKAWINNPDRTFPGRRAGRKKPDPAGRPRPKRRKFRMPETVLGKFFAVTCGTVALSVLFVLVMFLIYRPFSAVPDVETPNLIGVGYEEATTMRAYDSLVIVLDEETYNSEYDAGLIFHQTPAAGEPVKKGTPVHVRVSAGTRMQDLPILINQEATAACSKLVSLGFKYTTNGVRSETVPKGHVVRTSPDGGAEVPYGSEIAVLVSSGSDREPAPVPEVLGFPEEAAVAAVRESGFEPYVTYRRTGYDQVGVVVSQNPNSPSQVPLGSRLTLVVGSENETDTGESTVTLQSVPPDLDEAITVTVTMNGENVFTDVLDPENTRLISIPLRGVGTAMADVLINGRIFKSASIDFDQGQYYWTADYSAGFVAE